MGEALVDIVRRGPSTEAHPGGSPLNVAVGLSRLGMNATLHAQFGRDDHGLAIGAHLAASGVNVTCATITDAPTSTAVATVRADGAAHYDLAVSWDPEPFEVEHRTWDVVHVGSIGSWLPPGADVIEDLVRRLRSTSIVTFDPNIRPALAPPLPDTLARVESLVAMADVVKASDEDLAWLYPDSDPLDVLSDWLDLGPGLVVVTRGGVGADAISAQGLVHVDVPKITLSDTIGAGDSFMAGLIVALDERGLANASARQRVRDTSLGDQSGILEFATRCAAITCSRAGANPPWTTDLR